MHSVCVPDLGQCLPALQRPLRARTQFQHTIMTLLSNPVIVYLITWLHLRTRPHGRVCVPAHMAAFVYPPTWPHLRTRPHGCNCVPAHMASFVYLPSWPRLCTCPHGCNCVPAHMAALVYLPTWPRLCNCCKIKSPSLQNIGLSILTCTPLI
jgi:hypothetical protein